MVAKKVFSVQQIAQYFIWKANQEGRPITNKKLQKILYYAQAWSLVIRDNPLFKEKIEAWVHGPAVREIYSQYKKFGFNPIKEDISKNKLTFVSPEVGKFLNEVWKVYGSKDAGYLEYLSHSEKPWQMAREGLDASKGSDNEITLESMREFYSNKLKLSQAK